MISWRKTEHLLRVAHALMLSLPVRLRYLRAFRADIRQIWENAIQIRIRKGASVQMGRNCHARKNVAIRCDSGEIVIGRNVFLNHNVSITALKKIVIGDRVSIANNVVIVDHDHDFRSGAGFVTDEVYIGENVWIGANAVILRGTRIGENSVIAAGSVVKGVIPPDSVVIQERTQQIRHYKKER